MNANRSNKETRRDRRLNDRKRGSVRAAGWILTLAVLLLLAACGSASTDKATEAAPSANAQSEASGTKTGNAAGTDAAPAVEFQSIEHLKGIAKVPLRPQRVVALSAAYIDHLLTIGEKPVGVNTEERYGGDYLPYLADQLEGVATVGSAEAPNLEAILQLDPDVILVESRTAEATYDQLNKIAPTVVLGSEWKDYDEDPDFWTEDLLKIAQMYGKTDLAEQKIAELAQKMPEVKALVEKSDHHKLAYLRVRNKMFQIYPQNGHPTNALLYHDLGFEPSAITPAEQREDLSLEGLADLDADQLILEVDPNGGDFLTAAQDSSLWKQVPAIKQGHAYTTDSFWLFKGWGVLGRTQIVEDVRKMVQ